MADTSMNLAEIEDKIKTLDFRLDWAEIGCEVDRIAEKRLYAENKHNSIGAWMSSTRWPPSGLEKRRNYYRALVINGGVTLDDLAGVPISNVEPFVAQ